MPPFFILQFSTIFCCFTILERELTFFENAPFGRQREERCGKASFGKRKSLPSVAIEWLTDVKQHNFTFLTKRGFFVFFIMANFLATLWVEIKLWGMTETNPPFIKIAKNMRLKFCLKKPYLSMRRAGDGRWKICPALGWYDASAACEGPHDRRLKAPRFTALLDLNAYLER